jgi:hypothetical protein
MANLNELILALPLTVLPGSLSSPTLAYQLAVFRLLFSFFFNMPRDAPKRIRTESTRQRESRENVEALQRKADEKKANAKARKDRREEAAEDNLLVERDGESPEVTNLCSKLLSLLILHNTITLIDCSAIASSRVRQPAHAS